MKNINKIFSVALGVVLAAGTFTNCEDEDKARFPELGNGGFIKFVEAPVFDAGADPTSANFDAMVEDPNGTVASYELEVVGDFDGAPEDTLSFRSTTTFPFDVGFTGADMAALFNVPIETFQEGDSFEFFGTATTTDGVVYNSEATAFIQPTPDLDPSDPDFVAEPGAWNMGTTDNVLLTAEGLLQAFNYEVEFTDPPVED